MAQIILNNVLISGNEEEAVRDGYYLRKPDGTLEVTQKLPAAILRETANLERLSGMAKDALSKGATVEAGMLGIGEFVEKAYPGDRDKAAAYRAALVAAGIDPDAVWETAKAGIPAKESGPRLRAWEMNFVTKRGGAVVDENMPKGRQVTPSTGAADTVDAPAATEERKEEAA